MTIVRSANRGVSFNLLTGESVDETTSPPLAIPNSFHQHKISITGSAGVSAGAITIESAPDPLYEGTWSPITSPIDVDDDTVTEYDFFGIYSAIRARISTTIADGTVNVDYIGS